MGKKNTAAKKVQTPAITSLELMALETSRETLTMLRKRVRDAEEGLKGMEQDLIVRLEAGAGVSGPMTAIVGTQEGDCRPPWKEFYLQYMALHGRSREAAEAEARSLTPRVTKKVLLIGKRPGGA